MRIYQLDDPFGRIGWSEEDIESLRDGYKVYPYKIPQALIEKHGKIACYQKASRMGFAKGVRNPGVDLSHLTPYEIGYIAGFMDGEGSILFSSGSKLNPTIQFPNTNKESIEWLLKKLTVGGLAITVREKKNPNWKTLYQIHIGGAKNVYDILVAIQPHLIIKRKKADQALEILRQRYGFHGILTGSLP